MICWCSKTFEMVQVSTIFKILLLKYLLSSVTSRAIIEDEGDDQIVDLEELINLVLPPSPNASLLPGDDWDTWEPPEDLKNNFHYCRSGYDKDGLVVYLLDFGKFKYRELVQKPKEEMEEFWKYFQQFMNRAEVDGAKDNNKGIAVIIDFEGFSLKNFASVEAFKMALKLFISLLGINDSCKYGFIINVNYAAESFLSIAEPFNGILGGNFDIYGTSSEEWKPNILRKIPASQLPEALGGSKDWKPLPYQITKSYN